MKQPKIPQCDTDYGIPHPMLNNFVLVRTKLAGIHYGLLAAYGEFVYLKESRRIWGWEGAFSCSELSQAGPRTARVAWVIPHLTIPTMDVGEVHLMHPTALTILNACDDSE